MTSYRNWLNRWQSRDDRLSPSHRQLTVWLTGGVVTFLVSGWPALRWTVVALGCLYAILCVMDAVRLRQVGSPQVVRQMDTPQQRVPFTVSLNITWPRQTPRVVGIDMGLPATIVAQPGAAADLWLSAVAQKRGIARFEPVDVAWSSPLQLWRRMRRFPNTQIEVVVLPDVTTWRRDVIRVQSTLLSEGRHAKRYASGRSEFSHITEYTLDDDPRHINWSAAMRRQRLMTNVYQPERGQDVIIAVDTSRYMGVAMPNGKQRLDYAVETAAALSQSIWAAGDRVGLIAFADQVQFLMPPSNRKSQWTTIVQALASLEAKPVQGGYHALFRSLSGKLDRRSLVILLTELEGIVADTGFFFMQSTLARRHPVMVITLQDVTAAAAAQLIPVKSRDWSVIAGAEWILRDRRQTVSALSARGMDVVEAPPAELAVAAVRSYLARKWRGR